MNLRTKVVAGAIAAVMGLEMLVVGCTPQTSTPISTPTAVRPIEVEVVRQLTEAEIALAEVSRLTQESRLLDRELYEKVRYQKIIASMDTAVAELSDLENLTLPLFFFESKGFPVVNATGAGTIYIYLPNDMYRRDIDVKRNTGALLSLKDDYLKKIGEMKWDVEYLPPSLEDVLKSLKIPSANKEVLKSLSRLDYKEPAEDVYGKKLPDTRADLALSSAFFIPYLNKPIPVGLSPEPIPLDSFQLEPIEVDVAELEKLVKSYTTTGIGVDLGVAPRLEGNKLYGFSVWAKRAGTGYSLMGDDILALGKMSEPGYTGSRSLDELPSRQFGFRINLKQRLEMTPTPGEIK